MNDAGNGASPPTGWQPHDSRSVADHGRQIHHDVEALAATVRDATDGVQRYLAAQVEQRPFSTLGVAAGVGYVLGGGLSLRLTVVLLGAATRLGTAIVVRELGNRVLRGGSTSVQNKTPEHSSEGQRSGHED